MDGTKSFTICGDPHYFAPEIISQQGTIAYFFRVERAMYDAVGYRRWVSRC